MSESAHFSEGAAARVRCGGRLMAQCIKSKRTMLATAGVPEREQSMTKDCRTEKKPQGRPPAGASLIDGQWHTTEKSIQIAVARLLQQREKRRDKRHATRELLRKEHPELFVVVRAPDPKQTTLMAEARSDKQNGTLVQYQRKD